MQPPNTDPTPGVRIAHLTSVHARYDVRIFLKECGSLARRGYAVRLYVADGKGDEVKNGVEIRDLGKTGKRFLRMLIKPWALFRAVRRDGVQVVHFHDPEIIPAALALHWQGVTVIYDAHEDVPRQILSKRWLPKGSHRAVARLFEWLENFAARRFAVVVTSTPHIAARFRAAGAHAVNVNNFPMAHELAVERTADASEADAPRSRTICYVGGISDIRGIKEIMQALPAANATLLLAGPFQTPGLRAQLQAMPEWHHVEYLGVVDRTGVRQIMARSQLGVVLLHPVSNYLDSLPIKMFEYMSAGLPVLASDFPLWRQIIDGADAGACVNPLDPEAVALTLNNMLDDPQRLRRQGEAGRRAVHERYNWANEERTLLQLYRDLCQPGASTRR
ncbi:glycosyltransferase [Bordetella genomosp. 7]|uniref:Glycosyltransferase n=1 Tax=Bordetella genomosp. 7 TaxID=1416805 RepID=A0A261QUY9_9BORD|nr:glycosyltransferase [Bordetella genomosp. 7]OZI16541.1 glycosyltransferase [Bordetella genomosp. 7]